MFTLKPINVYSNFMEIIKIAGNYYNKRMKFTETIPNKNNMTIFAC